MRACPERRQGQFDSNLQRTYRNEFAHRLTPCPRAGQVDKMQKLNLLMSTFSRIRSNSRGGQFFAAHIAPATPAAWPVAMQFAHALAGGGPGVGGGDAAPGRQQTVEFLRQDRAAGHVMDLPRQRHFRSVPTPAGLPPGGRVHTFESVHQRRSVRAAPEYRPFDAGVAVVLPASIGSWEMACFFLNCSVNMNLPKRLSVER